MDELVDLRPRPAADDQQFHVGKPKPACFPTIDQQGLAVPKACEVAFGEVKNHEGVPDARYVL